MIQKPIRSWNSVPYTIPEADALTQELNARTSHNEDGYNSMSEVGTKLKTSYTKTQHITVTAPINLDTVGVHIASSLNPHSVTKAQVGLGSVDNTSDLDKPISTATQIALNSKRNLSDGNSMENTSGVFELTADDESLDVRDRPDHIYVTNSISSGRVLNLNNFGLSSVAGREITLIFTFAGTYLGMSDTLSVTIVKDSAMQLSTDGNSTFVAGDWVTFKILGIGASSNRVTYLEVDRGNFLHTRTGTGSVISLHARDTTWYNMAAASSATNFTTVNYTVGGNALIKINAATEPTVNSASTGKVKGSDFIPNTDMHMAIWYTGVNVQYNFIEL